MAIFDFDASDQDDFNDLSVAQDFELTVTWSGRVITFNDFSEDDPAFFVIPPYCRRPVVTAS